MNDVSVEQEENCLRSIFARFLNDQPNASLQAASTREVQNNRHLNKFLLTTTEPYRSEGVDAFLADIGHCMNF